MKSRRMRLLVIFLEQAPRIQKGYSHLGGALILTSRRRTLTLRSVLACITAVVLSRPAVAAQSRYTLTIYADGGIHSSSAAGQLSSAAGQATSSSGSNLGHVFVDLSEGNKHAYLGYYGDPGNPERGQLRVDADLARNGDWDYKKSFEISDQGYRDAHRLIDEWGTDGRKWWVDHNCGDFAEAMARIAKVPLEGLPKLLGRYNTPALWAQYLKNHGGIANPNRYGGATETWALMCMYSNVLDPDDPKAESTLVVRTVRSGNGYRVELPKAGGGESTGGLPVWCDPFPNLYSPSGSNVFSNSCVGPNGDIQKDRLEIRGAKLVLSFKLFSGSDSGNPLWMAISCSGMRAGVD